MAKLPEWSSNGIQFRTESNKDGSVTCFADFSGFVHDYIDLMNNRMTDEILDGCEAELNRHGWFKERTSEYDYFQSAEESNWGSAVECQGYHILKCGHRVPGDYFERPSYCCVCGAKVVSE